MAGAVAAGGEANVGVLSRWAAEARAKAEEDEQKHRIERVKGWKKFAVESVKEGGKRAHR